MGNALIVCCSSLETREPSEDQPEEPFPDLAQPVLARSFSERTLSPVIGLRD